jgi:Zn-dependent protease
MGDPTGKAEGRLTLNPLAHVDPYWTFILPLFTYFVFRFPLGGPKPAPVDPRHFANPRIGAFWSAIAGPASNLALASVGIGLLFVLQRTVPDLVPPDSYNALAIFSFFYINLVLAVANLIPVPPLDGSRFVHFVVGRPLDPVMGFVDRAGWLTAIPIFFAFYFLFPFAWGPVEEQIQLLLVWLFDRDYAYRLLRTYYGS